MKPLLNIPGKRIRKPVTRIMAIASGSFRSFFREGIVATTLEALVLEKLLPSEGFVAKASEFRT